MRLFKQMEMTRRERRSSREKRKRYGERHCEQKKKKMEKNMWNMKRKIEEKDRKKMTHTGAKGEKSFVTSVMKGVLRGGGRH